MTEPVVLKAGAATDAGAVRSHNEDAFLVGTAVFVVADGMGGHEAGEVAAAAVTDAFAEVAATPEVTIESVESALGQAQLDVADLSATRQRGAGSTVVAAALASVDDDRFWFIAHVGDSRAYSLAGGALTQLTSDHSVVQELVDAGELTRDEARHSRRRNVITRAVGAPNSPPDFAVYPVVSGERLLLCSDGLTGELEDAEIVAICQEHGEPGDAAVALCDAAVEAGGRDNVTVVVVDVASGATRDTSLVNELRHRYASAVDEAEDYDDDDTNEIPVVTSGQAASGTGR